ncbi:MAG: hypothetical protein RSB08_03050, partial [Clostridia bacterium]
IHKYLVWLAKACFRSGKYLWIIFFDLLSRKYNFTEFTISCDINGNIFYFFGAIIQSWHI